MELKETFKTGSIVLNVHHMVVTTLAVSGEIPPQEI